MPKAKQDPQRYRPVVNNGHPDLNPESVAYQEYWEQELDRCINGFKPKGMKNGGKVMPKGMKNGGKVKPKGMRYGGKVKPKGMAKGGRVGGAQVSGSGFKGIF